MESTDLHISVRPQVKPLFVSIRQLPPPPYEVLNGPNLFSSTPHIEILSINVAQQSGTSKELSKRAKTTMSSSTQKVLRPLPAIPSPSASQSFTSPRPRPLPSPPCTGPFFITQHKSFNAENVDLLMSDPGISDSYRLPRSESLSSLANALKPPKIRTGGQLSISPSTKLPMRREGQHLGRGDPPLHHPPKPHPSCLSSPVDELIFDESDGWETSTSGSLPKAPPLASNDRLHGSAYVKAAVSMDKFLGDSTSENDVEGVDEKDGDKTVRIECVQPSKDTDPSFDTRLSCHWLREKRGQRWEEKNYQSVLDTLRSL